MSSTPLDKADRPSVRDHVRLSHASARSREPNSCAGLDEALDDVRVRAAAGHPRDLAVAETGDDEGEVASFVVGELREGAERVAGFELVVVQGDAAGDPAVPGDVGREVGDV
jgi:hypothetical protein